MSKCVSLLLAVPRVRRRGLSLKCSSFMIWRPLPASKSNMRSQLKPAHGRLSVNHRHAERKMHSASEPCSANRSAQKQVFRRHLPIRGSYSMHRWVELEIWRFSRLIWLARLFRDDDRRKTHVHNR